MIAGHCVRQPERTSNIYTPYSMVLHIIRIACIMRAITKISESLIKKTRRIRDLFLQ